MVHWVKVITAKPDDFWWITETHMVEEENLFP